MSINELDIMAEPIDSLGDAHAFKNAAITFRLRFSVSPMLLQSFFFNSTKLPSMALVELGIFNAMCS